MRTGRMSVVALALVAAACTVGDGGTTTSTPITLPPETTTTTEAELPTNGSTASCIAGDVAFAEEGLIASFGRAGGDAAAISGLRWSQSDGCERFVIDLATGSGSPAASLGQTLVELRPASGIIRVRLPEEVATAAVADTVIDGSILTHAYVIRLATGGVAVDVHLASPTGLLARSFTVGSPARIVVDVQPDEAGAPVIPPAADRGIVLLAPRGGSVEYPLIVRGYAQQRGTAINVALGAGSPEGVVQRATLLQEGTIWSEFAVNVTRGPVGSVQLYVGEGDPVNTATPGIRVELSLS